MSRHAAEAEFWDRVYEGLPRESEEASSEQGAAGVGAAAGELHSVYSDHGGYLASERFFASLVTDLRQRDVVCVGGGVDRLALHLAAADNDVLSVDLSQVAVERTRELARQRGLASRLEGRRLAWEDARFERQFDVAVVHHAWHHMQFEAALANFQACLRPGGVLIAMEPVCRLALVRRIHQRLPFHPLPFIAGERELDNGDLKAVRETFARTSLRYFDALSRESVAWNLVRFGLPGVLRVLSRLDALALGAVPPLRYLATYVVFQAWR